MQAAVLATPSPISKFPLAVEPVPAPEAQPGYLRLKALAGGGCPTDLHTVEADPPPLHSRIIPGHQIVGQIIAGDQAGAGQAALPDQAKNKKSDGVPARAVEESPATL